MLRYVSKDSVTSAAWGHERVECTFSVDLLLTNALPLVGIIRTGILIFRPLKGVGYQSRVYIG